MWYVFPTNMQDSNPLYNLIILFQLSEKNHNSFLLYIAYIRFKSNPHLRAKYEHDLIFQRIARNHGSLARLISDWFAKWVHCLASPIFDG